ncbi:MAG: glucose 1-dehydrogenase [Sphingomonadales bacterium]|jgi:NAD(P)-dependent dehydrogenase (short-subunit alcohol dehydrogenase family)|nr:glucose 1-dehydrogenase [Sphingomonadales bacterium]
MQFAEKVCLVTGGASGIGRATCEMMAARGGRVAVVDIDDVGGEAVARGITAAGGEAVFLRADVSAPGDARAAVEAVAARWGRIDVLVNNAAVMTFEPVVALAEEDWRRLFDVNVFSMFLLCKYALPHMKGGAVVNVSSVHAHQTVPNVVPYAASKGAVEAFTRGLSAECAGAGTRVNCVAPGAVDTPMLWSNPNLKSGVEKLTGPVADPRDLAAAICFLASDESRSINGSTVVVDNGQLRNL